MPQCPICLEEIKVGARRCPHCQSSLESPGKADDGRVTYIVDRGLLYFGKFVLGTIAFFILMGVLLYGLDLKKMGEVIRGIRDDAQKTTDQVAKTVDELGKLSEQVKGYQKSLVDELKQSEEHQKELKTKLKEAETVAAELAEVRAAVERDIAEIKRLERDVWQSLADRDRSVLAGDLSNMPPTPSEAVAGTEASGIQKQALSSANKSIGLGKLWRPGSTIRYRFLGGTPQEQQFATEAIQIWQIWAGLSFVHVNEGEAEIRISFEANMGIWSYVGTDCLNQPAPGATMNLSAMGFPVAQLRDQYLHCWGHALGLVKEFQLPEAPIFWNVAECEQYFKAMGWDRDILYANLLRRYSPKYYGFVKEFDPDSIMMLHLENLPEKLFKDGKKPQMKIQGLSEGDKQLMKRLYPPNAEMKVSPID